MKTRFENAYNSLVKAFFDGTLAKGTCAACACGNIAAASCGVVIPKNVWFRNRWRHNDLADKMYAIWNDGINNQTGYDRHDLKEIESAFENNTKIHWEKYPKHTEQQILEDQYNGLVAVLKVMEELDGIEHSQTNRFAEHPKLVLA